MGDTLLTIAAKIDSIRAAQHSIGSEAIGAGKWVLIIGLVMALIRAEKVAEFIGRVFEMFGWRHGEPKRGTVPQRINGHPCNMHPELTATVGSLETTVGKLETKIDNVVDMATKHHSEQREDMKELRALIMSRN